jgi:NADH-ubiquinone oxidoreductase chain 1
MHPTMRLLYGLLEVLVVLVPILLAVAFMTIIERKTLAAMQRRVGPNVVGYYGVLQPFADALKLFLKENVIPQHALGALFMLAPLIALVCSLLGWAVVPLGGGLAISDFSLGVLYSMAVSSVGVFGLLLAGWAANSKFAFLGSLRSAAQMISYELILSSAILAVVLALGSFHYARVVEAQEAVWLAVPLLPLFAVFFISALAETNRTPFDLPEAESELVSGAFTEHGSTVFVFFFLAEYSSIILMSALTALLFAGGYGAPQLVANGTVIDLQSLVFAAKTAAFCFLFVWVRATLPRLRYDQLMQACWMAILPLVIALITVVPSLLVAFDMTPL